MKVIIAYTVRKEVEVEIDDRFADLLDPDIGYRYSLALAKELKSKAERAIKDRNVVEVVEVATADREDILQDW